MDIVLGRWCGICSVGWLVIASFVAGVVLLCKVQRSLWGFFEMSPFSYTTEAE